MFPFVEKVVEMERMRAQQRQRFRSQHYFSPDGFEAEGLVDTDDGRRRKTPAMRSQKLQPTHALKLDVDDCWSLSALGLFPGYNAFDFRSSPEAFGDDACSAVYNDSQRMTDVANQVASMGFHCTSLW
ncbi:unnamed protein product [Hyaloperonospora brassicae]|uniref:Uncharacterized protein n=1 Tax=Hyaloperonospora brassicae TaxID=162125 RepID=A0AAV0U311_HYABA|nr:unnamed protein product [Hyaloperonospora brassicae]